MNVVLGFILGLFISVGAVLARAMLRRGVEAPEQLEEHGISVYATIPMSEWLDKRTRLRKKNLFSNQQRHRTKNIPSWRWITRRILLWKPYVRYEPVCISL